MFMRNLQNNPQDTPGGCTSIRRCICPLSPHCGTDSSLIFTISFCNPVSNVIIQKTRISNGLNVFLPVQTSTVNLWTKSLLAKVGTDANCYLSYSFGYFCSQESLSVPGCADSKQLFTSILILNYLAISE